MRLALVRLAILVVLGEGFGSAQTGRASVDAVRAVIAQFDRVNLVGLGERHWSLEDSEFRLRLIRDPEFSQK
jgi:hypothetical protein